ncbi:MAG: FAD-dependent monooxygenase [Planctomycetes bacterium]|nr:FAD-dependent monooxygenase [Planctomycetota bacterium]
MPSTPTRIGIVGAGPAGLLLASALARRGVSTTLLERDGDPNEAPRFNPDRSYTIDITGHGLRAIRHIDAERHFDERMLPFKGLRYFGKTDEWPLPGWTGSRGDILRALTAVVRERHADLVRVHYGHRVTAVDVGSGRVTSESVADGRVEHAFDLVVGADGAGSAVRDAMASQVAGFSVVRRNHPNWCTMLALDRVGDALHPHYLHGLSVRPFCVAGAIRGDAGPGSYRWFCAVGTRRKLAFEDAAAAAKFLEARVPDARRFASDVEVEAFSRRPCYPIGQRLTCSAFHGGRAVLIGDASAAFPPIGQGVNAAMESAMVLYRHLDDTAAYTRAWKPQSDAVSWLSVQSLFERRLQMLRLVLTRWLWANPFELAKSAELPYADVVRRVRRFWPLWA